MSNTPRLAALTAAIALAALTAGDVAPAHGPSFTVNATHDAVDAVPGDSVCADASGACTLRAAVEETNALPGADSIATPAGTYVLTPLPGIDGQLFVKDDLEISGAGAAVTIIRTTNPETEMRVRIFNLFCFNRAFQIKMSGVTITGGFDEGVGGGGIYNCGHALHLKAVSMTRNAAASLHGGALYSYHNSNNRMKVVIEDSLFSQNWAQNGGAIANAGAMTISNSTISNNSAVGGIGGIASSGGTDIVNTTVTANGNGGVGNWLAGSTGEIKALSSIIANNLPHYEYGSSTAGPGDCVGPITSLGHNLDSDGTCSLTGPGDLSGVDPQLTGLQDNGGLTLTHGLYPSSPAIDAGDPNACPATDQRGVARPQGAACDIGAYEYVTPPTAPPTDPPTEAPPPPDPATEPPTSGPTPKPKPSASASPSPAPNPSATAARTQRRLPTPAAAVLVDAPEVVEEEGGGGVSPIAAGLAAVGALGLFGSAATAGFFWHRKRRNRLR